MPARLAVVHKPQTQYADENVWQNTLPTQEQLVKQFLNKRVSIPNRTEQGRVVGTVKTIDAKLGLAFVVLNKHGYGRHARIGDLLLYTGKEERVSFLGRLKRCLGI